MDPSVQPPSMVALLFTDIEGSTRLWQEHPVAMRDALARHDALLAATIAEHGGTVFKTVGDAFCATFERPSNAVAAAVAIQSRLTAEPWPDAVALKVRAALHFGEVVWRDQDAQGPTVERTDRLLAAAHGGQVLVSEILGGITADHLPSGYGFRNLGLHHLADLDQPIGIFQLLAPELTADFPPLRTLDRAHHNLPLQLTRFVGRREELAALAARLPTARLLTLTGVGGTGKTRLALQLAADCSDRFGDGVRLVELAAITDPDRLPAAVAEALGVQERPGRSVLDTLIDHAAGLDLLIVLDNCEHLVTACAGLVDRLLKSAPQVSILATSRESIGILGEVSWPVPSLGLPPAIAAGASSGTAAGAGILDSESVQLFLDRARAVKPELELSPRRVEAVAEICRRLDGIPLAIELAAARVRMLPPEQIHARLDDRFKLLTGGTRTALPRHQTLLAALDWSYDLLDEPERLAFERLAVFRGGWTLAAAEAVIAGEGLEGEEVLDYVSHLVDKSLVVTQVREGEARYHYLETVRQHARDKLVSSLDAERLRDRHLDYFTTLANEAAPGLRGPEQTRLLAQLKEDEDNLRQALEWAGLRGDAESALRLAGSLWWYWFIDGDWSEGRARLEAALALAGGDAWPKERAMALNGAGALAAAQGDNAAATGHHEASLSIRRALGDRAGEAVSLSNLGVVATQESDFATAAAMFEQSVAIRRELNVEASTAPSLSNLSSVVAYQGDYLRARSLLTECLAIHRAAGNTWGVAAVLGSLGEVANTMGEFAEAGKLLEESLEQRHQMGDNSGVSYVLLDLGTSRLGQGRTGEARAYFMEALARHEQLGDKFGVVSSMMGLADVKVAEGDLEGARATLEEQLPLCRETGDLWGVSTVHADLALVWLELGCPIEAGAALEASMAWRRASGARHGLPASLESAGRIAILIGRLAEGARFLGASEALRRSMGIVAIPVWRQERLDQTISALQATLGKDAFDRSWSAGVAESGDKAVDEALAFLRAGLPATASA